MDTLLSHWISEYGYWATFFGTIAEGETAAFLSGIAAHHQLLSYPVVMLVAAPGGIISDNILFMAGYFYGNRILPKIHKHTEKIARLQRIIHRRESLVIPGVRFAYGLRTIGPVIIGAAGINPLKFFVLNILGGVIWGSVIVSAGYFVSAAILALPLHTYLAWFLILAAVAGLIALVRKYKLKL